MPKKKSNKSFVSLKGVGGGKCSQIKAYVLIKIFKLLIFGLKPLGVGCEVFWLLLRALGCSSCSQGADVPCFFHPSIHPVSVPLILIGSQGTWSPSQVAPCGCGANPSRGTHTHIHTPIRTLWTCLSAYSSCLCTGGGNRRKCPEETPETWENMQMPQTQGRGGTRTPNPIGARQTC